ncbi:MAG: threonylcarbamoyl-AMP synthase, partial [Acidobacteria bacterium]|nr:threonylcarbamoyl-AMP synthase [Acidobacteriota bacterium]
DVTGTAPVVLRRGMLQLQAEAITHPGTDADRAGRVEPARSPGQTARHYAPRKPLVLMRRDDAPCAARPGDAHLRLPDSPEAAASCLYAELHRLDADPAVLRIVATEPPDDPRWDAIRDRLARAAR